MNKATDMAKRIVNAEKSFIDSIIDQFNVSQDNAIKVLVVFRKLKVVKINPNSGQFELKHGAYWEKEVIQNAITFELK